MELNGSTTFGPMIQGKSPGRSWIALDTYLLHEKGIPPPWSTMLCIFLVDERKMAQTSAISQPLRSHPRDGSRSKTWDLHLPLDPAIP